MFVHPDKFQAILLHKQKFSYAGTNPLAARLNLKNL